MNVNELAKWHLEQAIEAGKRVLRATTNECRKANEDAVAFHSDAVELLSDLMDAEGNSHKFD